MYLKNNRKFDDTDYKILYVQRNVRQLPTIFFYENDINCWATFFNDDIEKR